MLACSAWSSWQGARSWTRAWGRARAPRFSPFTCYSSRQPLGQQQGPAGGS